jgi:hypothetical protein
MNRIVFIELYWQSGIDRMLSIECKIASSAPSLLSHPTLATVLLTPPPLPLKGADHMLQKCGRGLQLPFY